MTRPAKKITELQSASSIDNDDMFIVQKVTGANNTTNKVTGAVLKSSIVSGPFINDGHAANNSVSIGHQYYLSTGEVRVRLT